MTRNALRAALSKAVRDALICWFAYNDNDKPLPVALKRAGWRKVAWCDAGCERNVLIGRTMVAKNDGWKGNSTGKKYRRNKAFAPTIKIADDLVVQPRGRVLANMRWSRKKHLMERYYAAADIVSSKRFDIHDTHDGNFAVFPDRTVRCIDY